MSDDYDISKAFERVEDSLIDSMMRNFSRHRAEETAEGYNWPQWQAEQLKALEEYRKTNAQKFGKQFKSINSKVEEMIRTARADGNADQEAKILEAIKKGAKFPEKPSRASTAEFFKANDKKINALVKSTTDDLKEAETAVLRMSNDKYRKAVYNAHVAMSTGAVTYEQAVDMACKDMLNAGLNCVEYKNGARHTLSDYADMAVKTANKRAYLRGEGEERARYGYSLVVANSRQGGCPVCAKYIGKVFIDDVYSNGKKSDGDYPLLSTVIKAGFLHPRCKDSTSTYYPELDDLDTPLSDDEIKELDRQRGIEEKQQYAERQAKRFDRRAKYSLDEDNKRIYGARAEQWREKAHSFSVSNDDKAQYYKPITETKEIERFIRKDKEITLHKTTSANDIYLSESVKIKRKAFHKFDTNISEVYKMLGEIDSVNKPKIYIISPDEMTSNAVASYQPIENILSINSVLFNTDSLVELQKDFACPDSEISTILHELIHWQDADKYKRKFGEITDFGKYIEYLNKKFAPKLEKLQKRGYNIFDISEYASNKLNEQIPRLDEVYTEYRVKKMIGG